MHLDQHIGTALLVVEEARLLMGGVISLPGGATAI